MTDHEDILSRTLRGLEDDLEELRSLLSQQVDEFEGGLKKRFQELPVWLSLPYGRIKQCIKFPQDGSFGDALLGPRAVAFAAAEIEQFVHTWIGQRGELVELGRVSQSNLPQPWKRDASLLTVYLDNLEHEAQAVMIASRTSMSHLRDEILNELEEQRRVDTEALEDLVSRGDLEQGQQARREIAELWEEQRRRADTFAKRWEQIERHIERGLDITESGLDTLRELLENAELGLAHAYPAPNAHSEVSEPMPADESASQALSAELRVLPSDSSPIEDEGELDFDPYGEESEASEAVEDLFEALAEPISPAKSSRGATLNVDFFKSEEVNDDLVFANESQLDGPMIDFSDEETGEDRIAPSLFSPQPGKVARGASSPYDIFKGDEPEHTLRAGPDRLRTDRPTPAPTPAPSVPPRSRTPERPAEPTPTPPERAQRDTTLPGTRRERPAAQLDSAPSIEVDDASTPTLPSASALETRLTALELTPPVSPEAATTETATAPMLGRADDFWQEALDEEDFSSDSEEFYPAHEEVVTLDLSRPEPTQPPRDAASLAMIEEEEHEEIATQDLVRTALEEESMEEVEEDVTPTLPAPSSSETPPRETPRLARSPERERAATPVAPEAAASQERVAPARVTHESAPPAEPATWQAEATRRRQERTPVRRGELLLSMGLPLAILLVIVLQAAVSAPEARWIVTHMMVKWIGVSLCAWMVIGPFALQYKLGWRGNRPVPFQGKVVRDEAELLLDPDRLEVGHFVLPTSALRELSLERWVDERGEQRGLELTLVDQEGELWRFFCERPEGLDEAEEGLPISSTTQWNRWEVSHLTFDRLLAWASAHLPAA